MDNLICKCLSVHTTTLCTLKCIDCGSCFPKFSGKSHILADLEKTISALDRVFQLYDSIMELRFAGAEAFLYPKLGPLMEATAKYRDHFQYGIIATNGTYIPSESILKTIQQLPYRMLIRIDNYGDVSNKKDELMSVLSSYDIEFEERNYAGEDQAFGGWVALGDFSNRCYTPQRLKQVFETCRYPRDGSYLLEDKLTNCCHAIMYYLLEGVPMPSRETVDFSGDESIEVLRNKVIAWKNEPFVACKYCNGFDPENSPRIPAGVQPSGD